MNRSRQCALCGASGGCGRMVMGQYICLDCQVLLDDPKKRVLGCRYNRRTTGRQKSMELAKAKE